MSFVKRPLLGAYAPKTPRFAFHRETHFSHGTDRKLRFMVIRIFKRKSCESRFTVRFIL